MDESPPPMDDVPIGSDQDEDGDELFGDKKEEPLFADTEEPPQEEEKPEVEPTPVAAAVPPPTLETSAVEESPKPVKRDTVETAKPMDLFGEESREPEEQVSPSP